MTKAILGTFKCFSGAIIIAVILTLALLFAAGSSAAAEQYGDDSWGRCEGECDGNMAGRPDLRLTQDRTYWASYSDYGKGLLSIDFHVRNLGPGNLYRVALFKAEADRGVKRRGGDLPELACGLPVDGEAAFTLVYRVPAGISNFMTTTFAQAKNSCGRELMYPDRPGQN